MSKGAELETTKLSGYRDKVFVSRGRKKSRMREEALDPYSLNFHCSLRIPNFSLVFVWFFFPDKCCSVHFQTSTGCRNVRKVKPLK